MIGIVKEKFSSFENSRQLLLKAYNNFYQNPDLVFLPKTFLIYIHASSGPLGVSYPLSSALPWHILGVSLLPFLIYVWRIRDLTLPYVSKCTLFSRWKEGNGWFFKYTNSQVFSLSWTPFHLPRPSFTANSLLHLALITVLGINRNSNSLVTTEGMCWTRWFCSNFSFNCDTWNTT